MVWQTPFALYGTTLPPDANKRIEAEQFNYVGLFSAVIKPNQNTQSPVYDDFEGKLKIQIRLLRE
jgi:hypothetical protein